MRSYYSHMKCVFFATIFTLVFATSGEAAAHRLNVFAWLDNDNVVVECNFGKNRPAMGATVSIYDRDTKKELVQGKTDNSGHFAFKVPQIIRDGHGLSIDVNAGQGHHGTWEMDASELYSAAALTAGFDEARIEGQRLDSQAAGKKYPRFRTEARSVENSPAATTEENIPLPDRRSMIPTPQDGGGASRPDIGYAAQGGYSQGQIRAYISEAVESAMAPIRHELAAMGAQGPSITEIIGGIGWIMGIVGIILYFRSRRSS